jgi:hypothetical protein
MEEGREIPVIGESIVTFGDDDQEPLSVGREAIGGQAASAARERSREPLLLENALNATRYGGRAFAQRLTFFPKPAKRGHSSFHN